MKTTFTLTSFTPAEAAAITGVSTDLQRDWRRHGYIEKRDGHARFDVFDLAQMLAMKMLADRGIGPKLSASVAEWCATGIAVEAFRWVDSWEGDHASDKLDQALVSDIPEAATKDGFVTTIISSVPGEGKTEIHHKPSVSRWQAKYSYLTRQLWRSLDRTLIIPGKCFIWWADGEHFFHNSFDAAISDLLSSDQKTAGAIVVLLFDSIASTLIDRAGRAFCHVEID